MTAADRKDQNCLKVKNVVLGAGISGLACACELNRKGGKQNTAVFEAEDHAGGLCHSFKISGFCFDSAVHLSFTENAAARKLFDRTSCLTHQPDAASYYHPLWLKHPVAGNLYPMETDEKVKCIRSFVERKSDAEIHNYGQWLRASYGDVIAERFYYVYTKKYWTAEPEELSTSWIGSRLSSPGLEKVLRGAFTDDTGTDYYAREMRYPAGGNGFETFLAPMRNLVDIIPGRRCVRLDLKQRYVQFQDQSRCCYEHLYSSIPLPDLVRCTVGAPENIRSAAAGLRASRISLVSVGIRNPDAAKWLWFYIYDRDILAARVNSPGIKCRENVPEGCSSLQFEIYHGPDERIDREAVIRNTKYALKKMEICKEEDIIFTDYRLLPYGNVIFYNGMEEKREEIREYYRKHHVTLMGRFGEWDYLWSDQSWLSGCRAAHA